MTNPTEHQVTITAEEGRLDATLVCNAPAEAMCHAVFRSCDCEEYYECYPDDRPGRHPLNRIKGDPERPLHEPSCRWHIAYRMHWWTAPEIDEIAREGRS